MTTERYIPAGTRTTLRDPGGKTTGFTTTKDVVLRDGEPGGDVRDPNDTRRFVKHVTRDGYTLYFAPAAVATRTVAAPPAAVPEHSHVQASLLFYDIPEGTVDPDNPDRGLPNPTWFLRRVAGRLNKSCWCIPTGRMTGIMPELHRLTRAGVNWNAIPFDPTAGPTILTAVTAALKTAVQEAVDGMPDSAASMDRFLENTTLSPEKAEKQARRRAEAVLTRTKDLIADLESAAAAFGLNPAALDLARAETAARATQLGMQERARLYYQAAVRLRESGGSVGEGMANALNSPAADLTTVLVAADALDDIEYGAGEELRAAFDDGPAAGPDVFDLPTDD